MGFKNEGILEIKWYSVGGSGAGSSSDDAASAVAGDVVAIPAGAVVTAVDVIVDTAVTGTSPQINVGDDDDADGFVADANVTEGTPGVYLGAGAYVASGAKKYYSAEGKEVKLALGGTLAAGKFAVVVHGYRA